MTIFSSCSNPIFRDSVRSKKKTATMQQSLSYLASDALEGRMSATKGERMAAKYVAEQFRAHGLIPAGENKTYIQPFPWKGVMAHGHMIVDGDHLSEYANNVVGFIDNSGDDIIIIGAHLDHLGHGSFGALDENEEVHNGADDNASGIAALFRTITLVQSMNLKDDVLFIAFSGEEMGLLGSNYFTKKPTVDLQQVKCMLNMDMVGRFRSEKGMAIYGTNNSTAWNTIVETVNTDHIRLVHEGSGEGNSDHASFYYAGIPSLHFFTGQHEDYHKSSDDVEKINFDGIEMVAQLLARVVKEVDMLDELPFVEVEQAKQEQMSFKVTMGVLPDYLYDGKGLRLEGVKKNRPAHQAGIQKGDVIIGINDLVIKDINVYMEALSSHEKGDEVSVKIIRGEEEIIKKLTF